MSRLKQVRVGMRVVDSLGQHIGTVDQIHAGESGPITTHGRHGLPGGLARALASAPDVHPQTAAHMVRTGYLRIRRRGDLPEHAYVAGDEIKRVAGNTAQVTLTRVQMLTG